MKKNEKPCLVFSISMHVDIWQVSPKLSAGPMCFWHGVVIPVPHHVLSGPVKLIRRHTKVIILWSNKCHCISLTLFCALPPFVSFMQLSVPPHVLSWGVSATTTGVMTKGIICGRIGSIRLQRSHQLTAWPAGETGGVVRGMLHMCVLLVVYLLWGGFKIKSQAARKDNWGGGGGGEFCFPLLLSHNDAILSYETLLGSQPEWTGRIVPAGIWKTEHRRQGGTVTLTV